MNESGEELGRGAEAILTREGDVVRKERVVKRYRHPSLDKELRKSRTRREAKILTKLPVPGPELLETDGEATILMRYIDGVPVKKILDENPHLATKIGRYVARLHQAGIIHGDLTTSNMLVQDKELFFIDFGLSFTSHAKEDKAVDIHLFKQALESKHYKVFGEAYRAFLDGYREAPDAEEVLARLEIVEQRGRNKSKGSERKREK